MPSSYKPSPLSYGSPQARSSPFRRPESPGSPSALRQTTPSSSPTKSAYISGSSRFTNPTTPTSPGSRVSRGQAAFENMQQSPIRDSVRPQAPKHSVSSHGNALSQLQPSQVRTLREGFQILDRDSDGTVGREDIADMLNQLGALPRVPRRQRAL